MWKFLPWRSLIKRTAKSYGVIDPGTFLNRLRRFSQPSQVQEPLELLRAGIVFHARGLINTKAIQHNLDWIWPYWVERQFDPNDPSFVPRAFSFSHINLTHRNWTAVGLPELPIYPIVDPRGLVTPLFDGWSLDFWMLAEEGPLLIPSKEVTAEQELVMNHGAHAVATTLANQGNRMVQHAEVIVKDGKPFLNLRLEALASDPDAWLVVAIRPYNPEGVQFIDELVSNENRDCWTVNGKTEVMFSLPADGLRTSHYDQGDVYLGLVRNQERGEETCSVGMATAASLYRMAPMEPFVLSISVPLEDELKERVGGNFQPSPRKWQEAVGETASLQIPDAHFKTLYDIAVRTVIMLSADDLYPGVYTYRRFWFRDACLMLNSMLALGLTERCRRILSRFPERQTRAGYYLSQEGEWDSNGQVLWILGRFSKVTNEPLPERWLESATKAVDWLDKHRLPDDADQGHAGLLPAGFSAEHLGANDFYYWDNFWAVGGLRAIADTLYRAEKHGVASRAARLAQDYHDSIERSVPPESRCAGFPAAPGRRMDSGAVGSLVADYPLQLYPPKHTRIEQAIEYLLEHSFHRGCFFQQMIHSGMNAYLTLDIAQTLLRNGDPRFMDLIDAVAKLASPTGQWPEAIHPITLGGCMGDGQHGWAAAEWIMMMRQCFVREEEDQLVIGSGIFPRWLEAQEELAFGPTLTRWGAVSVKVTPRDNCYLVSIDPRWHCEPPAASIEIPGCVPVYVTDFRQPLEVRLRNEFNCHTSESERTSTLT